MTDYVKGKFIKELRENMGITQQELADRLFVSNKTISKWENDKSYPDITLLKPLSRELGVSVFELLDGKVIINKNISANMLRSKIYVCPVCGNVIRSFGDIAANCHGIELIAEEATDASGIFDIDIEKIDGEAYIHIDHEMSKDNYISFIMYVTGASEEFIKLYPESNAECRIHPKRSGMLYFYTNRDGLMKYKI